MNVDRKLVRDEDRLWGELRSTIDAFEPEQALVRGYFAEGWTAKDGLAHIGTWLAEAGAALEQIRGGTYVELRTDELDELNARFLDAMRDVPLADVKAQATAARARMLHAWTELPDTGETALGWIRKSGAEHYEEHLPRLQEWLRELRGE
ncbi:MAG: hypothetical protein ACXWW9_02055 [Actinomycetota bacterium]